MSRTRASASRCRICSASTPKQYLPDFIVRVDDGHGDDDPLNLIVEIKGYRGEDAKEKANTMDAYWVPGVNNLGSFGRWAFAEFTEFYAIAGRFRCADRMRFRAPTARHRGQARWRRSKKKSQVEALRHKDKRRNIPTAELRVGHARTRNKSPIRIAYERRNRDLDPQLVWRGKDEQDWSDLIVQAPPLYIQEKVHPKVLIDDLLRQIEGAGEEADAADAGPVRRFQRPARQGGADRVLPARRQLVEPHDPRRQPAVMASLAEREGLRGKVQCIYFDPPYGIKFNSNFQWSTTSRDVKDGNKDHITREPEQVKAFRDTWRDGIHSYLTYLRDRLTVARDLLADSGSIFVQIGDENVHRVRALMDEVFGDDNFVSADRVQEDQQDCRSANLAGVISTIILWYAKDRESVESTGNYYCEGQSDRGEGAYTTSCRRRLTNLAYGKLTTASDRGEIRLAELRPFQLRRSDSQSPDAGRSTTVRISRTELSIRQVHGGGERR